MRIEVVEVLDGPRLEALAQLEQQVVAHDSGRLKLSWSHLRVPGASRTPVVLAWENDRLIGFLGVYTFGLPAIELAGMVAPDHRRQGVGSALLTAAREVAAEFAPKQVLLIAPRNGAGGAEFAVAHGGQPEHSEHAMALDGPPAKSDRLHTPTSTPAPTSMLTPTPARESTPTLRPATAADLSTVAALLADGFGAEFNAVSADELERDDSCTWLVLGPGLEPVPDSVPNPAPDPDSNPNPNSQPNLNPEPTTPIGTARTSRLDTTGSIYGFVIASPHRGRGIGRQVLTRLCETLREQGATRVELEVATENDRALGLYESVGFKRVITEDYFELALN